MLFPSSHLDGREVLECGGWRGTGLAPLWKARAEARGKRCVPFTPHPPHSKTLAHGPELALVQGRTAPRTFGEFSCLRTDERR